MTVQDDRADAPTAADARLIQALTDAWSEVLAGTPVAPDDDFFALGGHSLLVGRVALRCRAELGLDIPFAWFFEHPTARTLAAAVAAAGEECRSEPGDA
jgi:hypothetical protein